LLSENFGVVTSFNSQGTCKVPSWKLFTSPHVKYVFENAYFWEGLSITVYIAFNILSKFASG
jgi:hypothetical protein